MNTKKLVKYAALASGAYFVYSTFLAPKSTGISGLGAIGYPFGGTWGNEGYGGWDHIIAGQGSPTMYGQRHHRPRYYNQYPTPDGVMPDTFPGYGASYGGYGNYNPYGTGYGGYGGYNDPYYNPLYMEQPGSTAAQNSLLDAMEAGN